MNLPRSHARLVVRARDPRLRSLIAERLAGLGEVTVEANGTPSETRSSPTAADTEAAPDAVVEVQESEAGITPREAEVLGLLADGLANKEIAARLSFSAHTAKFHVESLLRKLDAANRAEAVREGIRRGLIGV
jgi:DNA-binding CsgD family transcriptional regulator